LDCSQLSLNASGLFLNKSLDNTESKVKKTIRKVDNALEATSGAIKTGIRKGQNTKKTAERKLIKSQALIKKQADKGASTYDMLKKIVNDPNIKL
jgi:hypothetical protein